MKKKLLLIIVVLFGVFTSTNAQISLFTTPPLAGGNGAGGVTFNVRANSSVFIDTIYLALYGTVNTSTNIQLWYNTTPINGAPNIIAPAWTQLLSAFPTTIGNSGTTNAAGFVLSPVVIPGGLLMNAGDVFGFAAGITSGSTGSFAYTGTTTTPAGIDTFTNGFITIYTGTNVGYGGPPPTPTNHVRQFTGGISLRPASGRDARIAALINPVVPVVGPNQMIIRIQNAAADPISQVDVGYQLDNNPAVLVPAVSIPTPLGPGQSYDYTFATPVNIPSNGTYTIKTWATNANGLGVDNNSANDTLTRVICTGLSGTYTVGATGSFTSIASAVDALNNCGLSGPVTFLIEDGTYYGSHIINNIPGASAVNTVTFTSATGNQSGVVLFHDTAVSNSNRVQFQVNAAAKVSFTNLSFRRSIIPTSANGCITYGVNATAEVINCSFVDQVETSSTFNVGVMVNGGQGLINGNSFSGFYYGVMLNGPSRNPFVSSNQVLLNTFTRYIYRAIYALNQNDAFILNNNISDFISTSTGGAGIWAANGYNLTIASNKITGNLSVSGIILSNLNADTLNVNQNASKIYNNVIAGSLSPTITSTSAVPALISVTGSFSATANPPNPRDAYEIVNNTITYSINTTSTSTVSGGLYFTGGSATLPAYAFVNVQNNHVEVNPLTGSLPAAFRLVRFTQTSILDSTISSHNNYRMGGATVPAFFRNNLTTTDYLTLANWQTATGRDANSSTIDPSFISPVIPIPTNIGFDNRGTPIAYVNTDVDNNVRSATTPDIGAYEFVGSIFSQIAYTPLTDTLLGTQRLFTVSITDSMSTITAGTARLFYKKSSQSTWLLDTVPGISGTNYTFNINYTALGGVAALDTIEYYVAVRNATNTVTTAPLGGNGLYLSNQQIPPTVHYYLILPVISGNYNVGVSGPADFPTITAAANFINNGLLNGAATFTLIDSAYGPNESFPILISGRPGSSSVNTITIKPATNRNTVVVTGAPIGANSLFVLQNLSNFIMDGSNNGTNSRNLRLVNNSVSTTSAVIHLRNQVGETASNVQMKNLHITGNSNSAVGTFGFHLGALTLSTAGLADGFSNVRIENNKVEKAGIGIYARGSTASAILGIQILNNEIGSVDTANFIASKGIDLQNALQGLIQGNEVYNLLTSTTTAFAGIEIGGTVSDSIRVNRNLIHDITTRYFTLPSVWGINVASGNNSILSNNVIYNVIGGNYSNVSNFYNPAGIRLAGGTGHQVLYNSINLYGVHNNTSTAGSASSPLVVTSTAVTGIIIRNNVFANSMTSTSTAASFWTAMWFPTSYSFTGTTINNNAYHVDTAASYSVARVGTATTSPLYRTVNDWRTWMSGQVGTNETASVPFGTNSVAPFISNTNLQIAAGTLTGIESGAVIMPVLGTPNTDFNLINRPASGNAAPDMGAFEFNGIALPDQFPPTIDSIRINPDANQCLPVARTLSVWARDNLGGRGIDSVIVTRQVNGVAQPLIVLGLTSGTAANGLWTATIPAAASGDIVDLTVSCRDSIGNSTQPSRPISYQDDYLQLTVSNDTTILQGDTATLRANFVSGSPLLITEVDLGNTDALEIQNVSASPVNVTGWKVVVSDSYTNINQVNTIVQTLSGTMAAGQTMTWSDASGGTNYWGNNLFWNPGAFPSFTGWILLLKPNNEVADGVFWSWPAANIQGAAITVGGVPINLAGAWNGDGINTTTVPTGITVSRIGNRDFNDSTGFAFQSASLNATNPGLQLPLGGGNVTWTTLAGVVVDSLAEIRVAPNTTTTYIATITDGLCTKRDTVVVTVTPLQQNPDVGVSRFITPTTTSVLDGSAPVPVTIMIKNYGPVPATGFDVEYRVNGGASIVTNSITSTIAPGDSLQHTFTVSWTPTVAGNIRMCANTTGVPNEVNRSNDTSCINLLANVSVEKLEQNNRLIGKVYPNPAESFVNFEFNEFLGKGTLEIHDKLGRVVATISIDSNNGKLYTLNTESWSAGLYSYRFIASDQVQYGSLIISQ